MKNRVLGIFLTIVLSANLVFAQQESFFSLGNSDISLPDNTQLQLGNSSLYQKFSWSSNDSSNLKNIFSQDYILNFTLNSDTENGMGLQGIIASDMGVAERNMLGFYRQEDFSNKQFLIDQQFTYTEGDISAGIRFLDIPERMVFSPNLRQQLTNRYNAKKMEDILDWQQMEYIVNFGQKDEEHLFLSYLTGEKQQEEVLGHQIDLSYNLLGELPINYFDSYHQDNEKIVSRDLLSLQKEMGAFSVEFMQSENYIMPLGATEPSVAEDIDRLVLAGNFDLGTITYIDSYHRTLKQRREITDSELGWNAKLNYDDLMVAFSDMETRHTDSMSNQDIFEDTVSLSFSYDRLETDRYLLAYINKNGTIIRNGHSDIVDEDIYKIVYMINSDQKLTFDYLDTYNFNQWSLHLSPMIRHWPIGIAYIDKNSINGQNMNRLALTFPQKQLGVMSVDASYVLQNFFSLGTSSSVEDIQINTEVGEVFIAAKQQEDETKDKSLESFTVGWQGDVAHADWLYNKNNERDNWSFEIGRQFGSNISTDYQLHQNEYLQEHNFAFNWDIIENMNFNTNLNLRDAELDSRKYSFDAQFSDNSNLIIEYFLNPVNRKKQIQEGECYRLALNHSFSNDLGIQYLRSNMSFDSHGNIFPAEEEGIKLLFDWGSLGFQVAYIQSIDQRLYDKSRTEYMISGDLWGWGDLGLKFLDYEEEPNFFDITLKHIGNNDTFSFHAVSNPPEVEDVYIGNEYQTFKYYLEYETEF